MFEIQANVIQAHSLCKHRETSSLKYRSKQLLPQNHTSRNSKDCFSLFSKNIKVVQIQMQECFPTGCFVKEKSTTSRIRFTEREREVKYKDIHQQVRLLGFASNLSRPLDLHQGDAPVGEGSFDKNPGGN